VDNKAGYVLTCPTESKSVRCQNTKTGLDIDNEMKKELSLSSSDA
jgi:hypothetical protein